LWVCDSGVFANASITSSGAESVDCSLE